MNETKVKIWNKKHQQWGGNGSSAPPCSSSPLKLLPRRGFSSNQRNLARCGLSVKKYKIVESLWLHFPIQAERASKIWNFILVSVPKDLSWWLRCKEVWCAHLYQGWSPASPTTSTSPAPAASRAPRPPSAWPGGWRKNLDWFTILGF